MPYRYLKRIDDSQYFHVFNRGNDRKNIFLSAADYGRFLEKLQEYSLKHNVEVVAFCLMRNHYHLLLQEAEIGGIAKLMQRLNVAHAMYFNKRYQQIGHLYQGPYKEKCINTDAYMLQVSAYIHNNPVGIGKDPQSYVWSSFPDYLGGQASWLNKAPILGYFAESNKVQAYQDFVVAHQDQVLLPASRPGLELAV